ncbi:MAG: hypothetical protein JO368_10870 [Acidimicrobiales bacterium]|nr:hypothetical protein [Acidimicrobiales bacterium]
MTPARALVFLLGLAVLGLDAAMVVKAVIVPRAAGRFLALPVRAVRGCFYGVARHVRAYETRDRLLAVMEPTALVLQLAVWIVLAIIGFTLVDWGMFGGSAAVEFSEAGSSFFTLGFLSTHHTWGHVLDFVAAATGLVLIALQIAYLPTLYAAYNRRETLVTLLESRAGAPAWGPELLIRHQLISSIQNLPSLFAEWERWAADVAESHTSYPSLLHLRSPRTRNSWVVSLIAVMDAAALYHSVDPHGAPIEARMCMRMGYTCLRDIAQVRGIPFDPDPSPDDPIALPQEEFAGAHERLAGLGFPTSRSAEEAWPHFRGWRVNYESVAYALASNLDAPPARWTGPRRWPGGDSLVPIRPVDRQPTARPRTP